MKNELSIFNKFRSLKKNLKQRICHYLEEDEKTDTSQEIWDLILEKIFSLTSWQIATIWSIALWAGVFLQYGIISGFIWNDIQWIYLVNIETAILSTFALILYCIISLFFPLILVISIWLTIISIVFNIQFTPDVLTWIFILFFIVSIIFFYFTWYRKLLLWVLKTFWTLCIILVFLWLVVIIDFSQKKYSDVEIVTWTETFTWKLFFSNWENYFIETWSGKIILPKSEVKRIVLP